MHGFSKTQAVSALFHFASAQHIVVLLNFEVAYVLPTIKKRVYHGAPFSRLLII